MKSRDYVRYSESFKLEVVRQIESGKYAGATAASRSYAIKGAATVSRWLRQYGNPEILPRQIKIMKAKEIDQTKELEKRVRELEHALAETQMRGLLSESFFEIACEHMGTDAASFKKKHATTLSKSRGARPSQ